MYRNEANVQMLWFNMKSSRASSHIIPDEFKLILNLLEFIQRCVEFQIYRCKMQGSDLQKLNDLNCMLCYLVAHG